MAKKRLIIVGGKGSGEIAMSVFNAVNKITNEWQIEGFLNDIQKPGEYLGNHKVLGPSESVKDYVDKGYFIHYTYHFNVKNKPDRVRTFKDLNIPIEANATAIHPLAHLDDSTKIGYGCLMLPQASTSFGAVVEDFCHVYTNGFVGHDSILGPYSTLAAHAVIGARVKIQTGSHIGLNSVIREDVSIGKYTIIGIGSVVIKNTEPYSTWAGNPAKNLYLAK
jgi:acetyltransferase EpsM